MMAEMIALQEIQVALHVSQQGLVVVPSGMVTEQATYCPPNNIIYDSGIRHPQLSAYYMDSYL